MGAALPAIAIGAQVLGTVQSMSAQSQEAAFADAQARRNRQIADQAAADALARGELEAGRLRMATTQAIGTRKAEMGASGVLSSTGSSLDELATMRAVGQLDEDTLRLNAAREAWGYKTQSYEIGQQNMLDQMRASNRQWNTLLTSGASLAGQWYQNRDALGSLGGGSGDFYNPDTGRRMNVTIKR